MTQLHASLVSVQNVQNAKVRSRFLTLHVRPTNNTIYSKPKLPLEVAWLCTETLLYSLFLRNFQVDKLYDCHEKTAARGK